MSALQLKRRSQLQHQQGVRKCDIRILDSSDKSRSSRCSIDSFQAAESSGSGDENDICYQRLTGWLHIIENHQDYFRSMAAAELDLATVYARIGDILKVPMREGSLFLDAESGAGVQAVTWQLKRFQQMMVENHCAISGSAKEGALEQLRQMHDEIKDLLVGYQEAVQPVFQELEQCKESVHRRSKSLAVAIAQEDSAKDPFIVSLEVEALLRKRVELEQRLSENTATQLGLIGQAEPILVERLASIVSAYVGVVSDRHRRLRVAAKRDARLLARINGQAEWDAFTKRHSKALASEITGDSEYAGRDSEWIRVLRQGVVALRESSPMFRSTWQSKYGVLTTRGFFHVFRSQGDVPRGAPETSVYLPRARMMLRSGTLQISSGSKFNRCRIIIQDAPASLERWKLLMESTCKDASRGVEQSVGLATPPDSSADEASPPPPSAQGLEPKSHRTPRVAARQAPPSAQTPTARGRPFSADVSMLEQQPLSAIRHPAATPGSLYLRPLDNTPLHMHQLSPVDASDSRSFVAYSPGFSSSSSAAPASLGESPESRMSDRAGCSLFGHSVQHTPVAQSRQAALSALTCSGAMRFEPSARVPSDYSADIWNADSLRIPDPAGQLRSRRPRSMMEDVGGCLLLDPTNPYLGDFFSGRNLRGTRSSGASSGVPTTLWRTSSALSHSSAPGAVPSPPPMRMAVGPCKPSPLHSREPIPESILLLGSGFVAEPCLEYLLRSGNNRITVACRRLEKAQELSSKYSGVTPVSLDVEDDAALDAAVAAHDLTISLIPYTQHARVMKAAIKARKHVVTTSYISPAMEELDQAAKDAGIICMNEIGLDPGIDHLYALKIINEVHAEGGKITSFESFCGGLPAPEDSNNPLGYKFSWSARGVLLALRNNAKYWENGKLVEIQGKDLMDSARPIYIYPAFATVGYGNRDSSHYRERYNIPHAQTCVRGTMRYQGFPEFAKTLVNMGFLDDTAHAYLSASNAEPLPWNKVTQQLLSLGSDAPEDLLKAIEAKIDTQDPEARKRIIHGVKWLGITSPDVLASKRGTYLDVLCARLEDLMMYGEGERDMILLQHKFEVENKDGSANTRTSVTLMYGEPNGFTAMAKTVGVPCGIATQLILDGKITTTGVIAPMTPEVYQPILDLLPSEGINAVEETI
ncbi:saccharopine dehydrogenase (NADP+, L-glutamate-forming) [Coemansia sp. Benny D115]|nr:saccharopine dehydrogenase (NADP+, L-glutamate-forming) [Coemansia sp. Benny D115]